MKGRFGRRWRLIAPLALVMAIGLAGSALADATLQKVLGGAHEQMQPYADDAYLTWTSNAARARHYDVFAEAVGTTNVFRVNARGTQGFGGNLLVEGTAVHTVIYQQIDNGRSDLYFFDLDSRQRTKVPGVNSGRWEWAPHASDAYVLFDRDAPRNGVWYTTLYLYNRSAQTMRKLGRWKDSNTYVPTGSVGDAWASWTVCTRRTCRVFLYDIANKAVHVVPTANGRPQYSSTVDEGNGTIYFVRSGDRCGAGVTIYRLPVGNLSSDPTRIARMPKGIDAGYDMSLAPGAVTGTDLLFERWNCAKGQGDIYAARDVTSIP
jgi:hypothetical protein